MQLPNTTHHFLKNIRHHTPSAKNNLASPITVQNHPPLPKIDQLQPTTTYYRHKKSTTTHQYLPRPK